MVGGEINGGIFWDIGNCQVPNDVPFEDIAGNIQKAVRQHHCLRGAITSFSAYGDFSVFPRKLRESCQRTGVKLVDIPNGRKDAADKAILVDMFFYAMDNKPPSFIVLISGDINFLQSLHILGQRGYTIMVVRSGVDFSPALINAGHYVLDWHTVASGGSFVSQNPIVDHRNPDLVDCRMSRREVSRPDIQNKNEMTLSKANIQSENPCSRVNVSEVHRNSSSSSLELYGTSQSPIEKASSNLVAGHLLTPSVPAPERDVTCSGNNIQPRRKKLLKRQIKWLIESLGGSLPLELLCSEYHKKYGVPLNSRDYGFKNVAKLLDKFRDKFVIKGRGNGQRLYVRISPNACEGSISIAEKKSKDTTPAKEMDINRFSNLGSISFDELPGQVKHEDPQLYAQLTVAKIEEPKLGTPQSEASIENSGSGTDMLQDDIGTPFGGLVGYGPEQRGVALVRPPIDSELHSGTFESVQGRVAVTSAVELEGQRSISVGEPTMSSFSRPVQSGHPSDDYMMRDSVQNISTRLFKRPRCCFCRGWHSREDCPMGVPVCFWCGQSGHIKSACPQVRNGSKQQRSAFIGMGDSADSQHYGGPVDYGHPLDNFETFEPNQRFAGHLQALEQSELPVVAAGTHMAQGEFGTLFGWYDYGPEQRGVVPVHPLVDSGLHLESPGFLQRRRLVASALEREWQCPRVLFPSSGDWTREPPMSFFSRPVQSRQHSDECMIRDSVQNISTKRSKRQKQLRCLHCNGWHLREVCPIGPVCHYCGQAGHMNSTCPQFREGSEQQRSIFTGRGGFNDNDHYEASSDSDQALDSSETVKPSRSFAEHSRKQLELSAVVTGEGNEKAFDVHISPNMCEASIPIVEKKNKDIPPAKEMDINRFSNLRSSSSDELPIQAKNVDPSQLYALPTETKSKEPKFSALLKDTRVEDSAFSEPFVGYEYFT